MPATPDDADGLYANFFRLSSEEQIRFTLIFLSGIGKDEAELLRAYRQALDEAKAEPDDKGQFYAALEGVVKPPESSEGIDLDGPAEDIFDFDLFAEGDPAVALRTRERVAYFKGLAARSAATR